MDRDLSAELAEQVAQAYHDTTPLAIVAGGSKAFYGNTVDARALDVSAHRGIIDYRPSELVITARCGTPLSDIETTLRENGQMFAFEPLQHSPASTLGGVIACAASGPRRGFSFAVRDAVLGARIINGKGEVLRFGGQVMKNVAGYDAARLMVGAQGTLGVVLDVSIKVRPVVEAETTLVFEQSYAAAQQSLQRWVMQGLPIRASCYYRDRLAVRICSTAGSIEQSRRIMGGDETDNTLWPQLRQQTHEFFKSHHALWRLSLPPTTPLFDEALPQLIEWGGGLRWIDSEHELFTTAAEYGGHAMKYRPAATAVADVFQPLSAAMLALQQRIKLSFDPERILNPGRLYPEL